MASFEVRWHRSTKKDLRNLPRQEVIRILAAVEQLTEEPFPHGSQKLVNSDCAYRIRIGDYRVVYEVYTATKVIEIQRVRHRRDVYRE
jgi:mRNA interferase RelE/StbE